MEKLAARTAGATMALTASFALVAHAEPGSFFPLGYWSALPAPGALPAVSAPSYKLQLGGGAADRFRGDDGTFQARGSYTAPLSFATGYQVDGLLASVGGDTWFNMGGHWFWRDPAVGLSGAYGEFDTLGGTEWWRLAYEGEAYVGRFTLSTATGVEFGDVDTALFTETFGFYYPTDDLLLGAGYRHDSAGSYGLARLEYQVAPLTSGMSIFADAEWNEEGFDRFLGGVKFHFGAPKSLIRRHREDDPPGRGNQQPKEKKEKDDAEEAAQKPETAPVEA